MAAQQTKLEILRSEYIRITQLPLTVESRKELEVIEGQIKIERRLNPPMRPAAAVATMRVRRLVDDKEIVINVANFNKEAHEKIETKKVGRKSQAAA